MGRLIITRDRRTDGSGSLQKTLKIARNDTFRNRHSILHWDCRSYRVATTAMRDGRRCVLRDRTTNIIIGLLEVPAENICWHCHTIYRSGLPEQRFWRKTEKHHPPLGLLGLLDAIVI